MHKLQTNGQASAGSSRQKGQTEDQILRSRLDSQKKSKLKTFLGVQARREGGEGHRNVGGVGEATCGPCFLPELSRNSEEQNSW